MRQSVQISAHALGDFSLLIYGDTAVGKTRFMGDALRYTLDQNPQARVKFANWDLQDKLLSLSGLDLPPDTLETCNDLEDLTELKGEGPYDLICLDSVGDISNLAIRAITKTKRVPRVTKEDNEWSRIHLIFNHVIRELALNCGHRVIMACHVQRHESSDTGEFRYHPDLPGQQAQVILKWFDLVACMRARTGIDGITYRTLTLKPNPEGTKEEPGCATKQRLPFNITSDIQIPEQTGLFDHFIQAINYHGFRYEGEDIGLLTQKEVMYA